MSMPTRRVWNAVNQIRRYNEWVGAAYRLAVHDTVLYVNTTAASVVVTMPSVSEARGIRYFVKNWLGANTVTFASAYADSTIPTITALALNASVTLVSDGHKWNIASN